MLSIKELILSIVTVNTQQLRITKKKWDFPLIYIIAEHKNLLLVYIKLENIFTEVIQDLIF